MPQPLSLLPVHLVSTTREQHHQEYDFQDELRTLLKKYSVAHDGRYMWD
jgi:hypothetical protein